EIQTPADLGGEIILNTRLDHHRVRDHADHLAPEDEVDLEIGIDAQVGDAMARSVEILSAFPGSRRRESRTVEGIGAPTRRAIAGRDDDEEAHGKRVAEELVLRGDRAAVLIETDRAGGGVEVDAGPSALRVPDVADHADVLGFDGELPPQELEPDR